MPEISKILVSSPSYYFIACIAGGLGVALWLYFRNRRNSEVPRFIIALMFVLRFTCTSVILFLLLNIFLRRELFETENPVILLAIDNSSSVSSGSDSAFVLHELPGLLQKFKNSVSEKYSVKTILFGSEFRSGDLSPDFNDMETDIDEVIKAVENNYANQNIGALVLISDGIYNKGGNPLYSTAGLGYPVYCVALGDTSEQRDALIRKINHNKVAYAGNVFPVEVVVDAKKLKGRSLDVTVTKDGTTVGRQTLKAGSDNFSAVCNFTLAAERPGLGKYKVSVLVQDGENNRSNNQAYFVIEVIDNREKVLLLVHAPHPDVGAIADVLASAGNYDTDIKLFREFNGNVKPYSVAIIHGFNPAMTSVLTECMNNNIPFWIVNPLVAENLPGLNISQSLNRHNDAEPLINPAFGLFSISTGLRDLVADLPAVKTFFGNYSMTGETQVLITQKIGSVETSNPILMFMSVNGLKGAVFAGDGLWRWKFRDFAEHTNSNLFNELVGKSVQYLSVKADKSFFRVSAPGIVNGNEPAEFHAEVYNKSYELISDPEVTMSVQDSAGRKFNYTFSRRANAYALNLGVLPAGEYNYSARTTLNDEIFTKSGVFAVREIISEKLRTVADHSLLYRMASGSGGKLFYGRELPALASELAGSEIIKPVSYGRTETLPLIDLRMIFYIILFLLAAEWFFRKRYLTI